jgi:Flp pilus assembly pilin Flp
VEYALMLTFVVAVVLVCSWLLGGPVAALLERASDALGSATGDAVDEVARVADPHCNYHAWGTCHGQTAGGGGSGNGP